MVAMIDAIPEDLKIHGFKTRLSVESPEEALMYASAQGISLKVPSDYYDGSEFACSYLSGNMRLPPFDYHSKINGYEYLRLITDLGKESSYYYRPKKIIIIPMHNIKR